MQDLRAYMLDKDGHIISRTDIAAASLEDAKNHAFQIVSAKRPPVYGMEIWTGADRLFPTGPTPATDPGKDLD